MVEGYGPQGSSIRPGRLAEAALAMESPKERPLVEGNPEPIELDEEQRRELAELIVKFEPFREMIESAAREWSHKEWQEVLGSMSKIESKCVEKYLEMADDELVREARDYAPPGEVDQIVEGDPGFGSVK